METFPKKFKAKKDVALIIGESNHEKYKDDQYTSLFDGLLKEEDRDDGSREPYIDHIAMECGTEYELSGTSDECGFYKNILPEVYLSDITKLIEEDAIEIIE